MGKGAPARYSRGGSKGLAGTSQVYVDTECRLEGNSRAWLA